MQHGYFARGCHPVLNDRLMDDNDGFYQAYTSAFSEACINNNVCVLRVCGMILNCICDEKESYDLIANRGLVYLTLLH
jgi:hypothetical protein